MDIKDVAARVRCRSPRLGSTRLVAIDGPGGAGKSTFAARLATVCRAQVLHTDDFASQDNPLDWWSRLEDHVLGPIGADQLGRYQRYDWDRRALAEWQTVAPGGVLILEGVSSARGAVRDRLSLSVWVDTPGHVRLARGLARDGSDARALWEQWMHDEDVHFRRDRTREHADVIWSGIDQP